MDSKDPGTTGPKLQRDGRRQPSERALRPKSRLAQLIETACSLLVFRAGNAALVSSDKLSLDHEVAVVVGTVEHHMDLTRLDNGDVARVQFVLGVFGMDAAGPRATR